MGAAEEVAIGAGADEVDFVSGAVDFTDVGAGAGL